MTRTATDSGCDLSGNHIELNGYRGTENAAVFLSDDGNGFTAPQVTDNYLSGGGFQLRFEAGVANAIAIGNDFGPLAGGWGEVLVSPGATVTRFEDNRSSTGALLPTP